mmetsp:Transcript_33029/g.80276  ORF Transcript_33029/g.80276 Transcript_33029/m.80276 type:complete len:477 (-) Transcript_33029:2244-3674(-)
MATIPFKKPVIFNARRVNGFVDIPKTISKHNTVDETVQKLCGGSAGGASEAVSSKSRSDSDDGDMMAIPGPVALQRRETMSGNIMVIEPTVVDDSSDGNRNGEDEDSNIPSSLKSSHSLPVAYWLQRRLGNISSTHGSFVRLAYQLRMKAKNKKEGSGGDVASGTGASSSSHSWELDLDEDGKPIMAMVQILNSQILMDGTNFELGNAHPRNELSALQLIYEHNPTGTSHVTRTRLISMCQQSIYCVLPYYQDGSLLQFCQSVSSSSTTSGATGDCPLEEPLARYLFRQIMQGLKTLQDTGLCHRNLSRDCIRLDGDQLDICDLGWAIRFDADAPVDEDRSFPLPGGTEPQYIPPEYFRHTKGSWDGFQCDLWSAGLILWSLTVGREGLFAAPIAEDKSFARLCIKGDVRGQLTRYGDLVGRDYSGISDELVDLLQKMLHADPRKRLLLEEVLQHEWLKKEEVISPTEWKATSSLQ